MYTTYKYKSIIEASESELVNNINVNDLCIFDIDSVFFPSVFDIREFIGVADHAHIESFGKIILNSKFTWIFTDRPYILRYFYLTKQLTGKMKSKPRIYRNSKDFISTKVFHTDAMIFNARKTSNESIEVISAASNNFEHVYYFAAQDFPWVYKDQVLLDEVEEKHELTNLIFIDIRRK